LIAVAVGAGGMTGMTSVLAVDPGMTTLSGSLVDAAGAPIARVPLRIAEELPPDGGAAAFPVTTAADGSFSLDVYAWGTAEAPANLSISTAEGTELEVISDTCSQTWSVVVDDDRAVTLADGPGEPVLVTAATSLLGEVCGTTATPGNNGSTGGVAKVTPPPTDAVEAADDATPDRVGPALTIGFVVGLLVAGLLLRPRLRAGRRD
jgi:hypothetical protein